MTKKEFKDISNSQLSLKHMIFLMPMLMGGLAATEYGVSAVQSNDFQQAVEMVNAPLVVRLEEASKDFDFHKNRSIERFNYADGQRSDLKYSDGQQDVRIEQLIKNTDRYIVNQDILVQKITEFTVKVETLMEDK